MHREYQTKGKAYIMEYVRLCEGKSFTASDVHTYLREHGRGMNLTTIYRNLEKLSERGVLLKYKNTEEECCQYQYADVHSSCREHLHMQCRACKKLFHLECGFMEEIARHLAEHHGFVLEGAGSMLNGLCEECRNVGGGDENKEG